MEKFLEQITAKNIWQMFLKSLSWYYTHKIPKVTSGRILEEILEGILKWILWKEVFKKKSRKNPRKWFGWNLMKKCLRKILEESLEEVFSRRISGDFPSENLYMISKRNCWWITECNPWNVEGNTWKDSKRNSKSLQISQDKLKV